MESPQAGDAAAPGCTGQPTSRDIFGAEIQYFRLEPEYWERILLRFKETGLRCVTTYVQWGTHVVGEPDREHPAGVLDFEGRTDPRLNLLGFLDLVQKHGLLLNFRCGPFCCNEMVHGGYPAWIVLGEPDMMVWDWQNRPTQGYWIARREGSQPSYLHPRYLDWCRKWFAEVDRIALPRLAARGGCIAMINLDNEVSYIVKDGFLDSDYNPVNVGPGGFYHQFLSDRYETAQGLSDAYGRRYEAIEDVAPPRQVPEGVGRDLAWYTDWIEFKTWVMCRYLRELRAVHEANGVRDVTFMTNLNPHRPEGVPTRMPEFERAAGGIVGYDFYRGTFMSYGGYHSMARVLKLMNASMSYAWSAEFMAGTWNKVLPSRVSDDHMRFMVRCALAHGCKAIDWFMFHDRGCWGDAPVSSHGHVRPSLEVLREVPRLLFEEVRDWDALVPQGDLAVVYDLIQHQHTSIGDPSPCADGDLHVGKPLIDGVQAGLATREYEGLFRLVEQAGCQADVVDVVARPGQLGAYGLAFLPGSPAIESAAGDALRRYVQRGGVLLVSGPWPRLNEHGKPIRFLDIDPPPGRHPAGIAATPLGRGQVLWHPAWLAQDEPEKECLDSLRLVASLLERYAPNPHVRVEPVCEVSWTDWREGGGGAKLYRQPRNLGSAILHRSQNELVLFVLNHYPEATKFRVTFGRDAVRELIDLETDERIPVAAGQAVLDIDRKSARVYRLVVA